MNNLSNINTIKDIMKRHGFTFSKSLGQNFLINPSVCPRIAEMGNANQDFGIIEIGTGFGVLTVELAKRAKKVVAIEIDSKLIPVLNETLSEYNNVKVINEDVLKVDLAKLIQEEFKGMNVAVCANLPYYITSPIIMGLLEQRLPIQSITVMVQKEAAQRLCAKMGTRDCGAVTAAVCYYSDPKVLFQVSRGSFMPAPNVDSTVIRLDIKQETPRNVENEQHLFKLIRAAFSQRRKTLANPVSSLMGIKKEVVIAALAEVGLKPTARAEELTLEQFILLSNQLVKEA
ncbi:16S rRNA (adenine(1518)-N(6)/adenine(1519)-N(6))-dimethyltransferase RsmA [Paludicola sp. MB14-C6]|uniref:16S rRNA (adenine(1518)-N(6)/adenine(1519)-N(6))- dimethyltransferase RsmA n=1 Tax=Paludihabitans sp. MB14-C6 TaxID=3070656 RepID=UPI0027DBC1E2|nr:16S rRNA (adenine(1518)-N(6)/adenine(1519)-N(6))-dimethyltransferase RsmA [Paludicola sp. MB14-C6]WMJ22020.1 16S rRNA (adenine(1518)-N(6)/adenine(1519)-N(6))-dimethyltransferase RsmA [Paludicola sp. MB14-C6]